MRAPASAARSTSALHGSSGGNRRRSTALRRTRIVRRHRGVRTRPRCRARSAMTISNGRPFTTHAVEGRALGGSVAGPADRSDESERSLRPTSSPRRRSRAWIVGALRPAEASGRRIAIVHEHRGCRPAPAMRAAIVAEPAPATAAAASRAVALDRVAIAILCWRPPACCGLARRAARRAARFAPRSRSGCAAADAALAQAQAKRRRARQRAARRAGEARAARERASPNRSRSRRRWRRSIASSRRRATSSR